MNKSILITGGAGFIGSHVADELLAHGHHVRALDNLSPQVHPRQRRPDYLNDAVELVVGDVRDPAAVRQALRGVDAVYHFAAAVGVGQSMYEVANYTAVNNLGTAVLLEAMIERCAQQRRQHPPREAAPDRRHRNNNGDGAGDCNGNGNGDCNGDGSDGCDGNARPFQRLIVASSMSIYGEGLYRDGEGLITAGVERSPDQLRAHEWEVRSAAGEVLHPAATPEEKPPALASVYALSKYDQERLCLMLGRAYAIPTVALRFFNAYGPRQALGNPYTGVLAIFASRLLNDNPPLIFEDGLQQRDFVSVHDIARACRLALEAPEAAVAGEVFNVGGGVPRTVREIAQRVASAVGKGGIEPEVTGKCRVGDIRHCFADISRARRVLGYEPRVSLEAGLVELAEWLAGQRADDRAAEARAELDARGLAI